MVRFGRRLNHGKQLRLWTALRVVQDFERQPGVGAEVVGNRVCDLPEYGQEVGIRRQESWNIAVTKRVG
jgi:hypothetical protein